MQAFVVDHVTGDGALMKGVIQRNPFRLKGNLCWLPKKSIKKENSASVGIRVPPPKKWG